MLVTGRRHDFARPVVEALDGPLTFITSNGALVKTDTGITLHRRLLGRHLARRVLEGTRRFRSAAALVFDRPDRGQVIYERIDWDDPRRRRYFERQRRFLAELAPLEAALTEDPLQVMFTGRFGDMRDLQALLRQLMTADECVVTATEYESQDFSLVDVVAAGCTKGTALEDWATRRGISREEVMAIGDNLNDREMLEYAGVGVVMGNAVGELKRLGYPITRSNHEAGVAAAIDEYALGRRP